MIAHLKPYSVMKDSGVPWLGEVPEHWKVLPNRALFTEVKERDHPDEEMLSVTLTRGVIKQAALLADSSKKDSSNQDRSAYKLVQPGDIAYNKMRAWQGAIGASDYKGIISPAYVVQRPHEGVHSRYIHYLFRTPAFAKEAERWSYGITSDMWSLRPEHFKMIYGCRPPLPEQAAIVRFLDHVDQRIRRYIRAKQKLIKLLEEQKQAIIHRAVTRGLDPNVRLKPSGVEWLGAVPEHWEVIALKRIARIIDGDRGEEYPTAEDFVHEGIPFLSSKAIKEGRLTFQNSPLITPEKFNALREGKLRPGDIVMTVRGTIGNSGLFTGDTYPTAFINAQMMIVRPKRDRVLSGYLLQLIQSKYFKDLLAFCAFGSAQQQLTNQILSDLPLPVPPVEQQASMLSTLQSQVCVPHDLACHARREIELLREYRTRLIADVVTGKLDVREAAGKLPDEPKDDDVELTEEPNGEEEPSQFEETVSSGTIEEE